jgi:hypothetical protein
LPLIFPAGLPRRDDFPDIEPTAGHHGASAGGSVHHVWHLHIAPSASGALLLAALTINTVRHDTLQVAERLEAELGDEQWSFIDGCPRDWAALPIPDGPITVGMDGGYVRSWEAKKTNFEVIVGKSTLAFKRDEEEDIPSSKRFGFVQTVDTKSKRRLFEVLTSQGFQLNQQITFLSDGEDAVRNLQLYMSPEAEHILDWFHVT